MNLYFNNSYFCSNCLIFIVEVNLFGLCEDAIFTDGLQQPWIFLGVSSQFGSLEGVNTRCSPDVLVIAARLGDPTTLSYIPSEQNQDQIR